MECVLQYRSHMLIKSLVLALAAVMSVGVCAQQTQSADPRAGETKAHRDTRMNWWREARFGMFIHWGVLDGKPTAANSRSNSWCSQLWMSSKPKYAVMNVRRLILTPKAN